MRDALGNTSNTSSLKGAEFFKIIIDDAIHKALIGEWENPSQTSGLSGFINDCVKEAMNDHFSGNPSNSSLRGVNTMKLVNDALFEHQTFSRVLYVLALGTPVTLLIDRW